jgi:type IV pilus assembly protein PilB
MAELQEVIVLLRNGTRIKGTLQIPFNPQQEEVVIVHQGQVEHFSLREVCCISFLLRPGLSRYRRLPSEEVERIVTVSGDEFIMRVLPSEVELEGFMATPEDDSSPVQRVYFVLDGVRSRELTDKLGAILGKEKLVDSDSLNKALDTQKELRSHRVGDILVNEGAVNKQMLEGILRETAPHGPKQRMRIGEVLVAEGLISEEQLADALQKQQREKGKRIGDILVESGVLSEESMLIAMAIKLRMRFIDLSHITPSTEAINMVPSSMARKSMALPIYADDKKLIVAISDPGNLGVIEDISFHTGYRVVPVFATKKQVGDLMDELYGAEGTDELDALLDVELTGVSDDENNEMDLTQASEAEQAPIVRLVNRTILDGVNAKASDIHIFPVLDGARVDFRVNGILQQYMVLSERALRPLISRIKIVAGMDISEHRLPQDGRIQMHASNREVEFRVSIMPGLLGESAVLRILDKGNKPMRLEDLGLSEKDLEDVKRIINSAHGFFMVTGPTGSGKSTTLLAAMASLTTLPKRLISVEDPVEGKIPGINQVQINSLIGFTFARALRNLLRHDPDILMVGEIRDQETAEIAVEAAMTGHMMLSSLHTNDAAGAFPRLINMGVEPFLVADTVRGVMAQQLLPRLCQECRYEAPPDAELMDHLKSCGMEYDAPIYKSHGCRACHNTGVGGRVLVYELLQVNEEISRLVALNSSEAKINMAARNAGMVPMAEMALAKAREGAVNLAYVMPLLPRDIDTGP